MGSYVCLALNLHMVSRVTRVWRGEEMGSRLCPAAGGPSPHARTTPTKNGTRRYNEERGTVERSDLIARAARTQVVISPASSYVFPHEVVRQHVRACEGERCGQDRISVFHGNRPSVYNSYLCLKNDPSPPLCCCVPGWARRLRTTTMTEAMTRTAATAIRAMPYAGIPLAELVAAMASA